MGKFDKDSLGNRMKTYESVYKQRLVPKMPIVLRIDGKAFHTFTRGMKKPFDDLLIDTMQKTMVRLCEDLQGAKFGYTQSDEITLISTLDDMVKSQAPYDGSVQKLLSIYASKATKYFNMEFYENVYKLQHDENAFKEVVDVDVYIKKLFDAEFDCRVMNIPEHDLINNLIWRQQDATRNSISSLAQANFSHNALQSKSSSDMMDMLMLEKNINWNDLETRKKRGSCCYKIEAMGRHVWKIDNEMPIITTDRNFIQTKLFPNAILDKNIEDSIDER